MKIEWAVKNETGFVLYTKLLSTVVGEQPSEYTEGSCFSDRKDAVNVRDEFSPDAKVRPILVLGGMKHDILSNPFRLIRNAIRIKRYECERQG